MAHLQGLIPPGSANKPPEFSFKTATKDEIIDDLCCRFILNLPEEELASVERICFQVEQAHWFYEDFVREENPSLPSYNLRNFSAMLFRECPLLHQWRDDHEQAFETFINYKIRVPVCGAILLNEARDKCVLVKGWKASAGWGFPKGKINQDEPPSDCAIREVLEETGYDMTDTINPEHYIKLTIREQQITLFIAHPVPEDFPFMTQTRKEISRIDWFKLTDLPTWKRNQPPSGKFYLISPFIGPLKAHIKEMKKNARTKRRNASSTESEPRVKAPTVPTSVTLDLPVSGSKAPDASSQSSDNRDPITPSSDTHSNASEDGRGKEEVRVVDPDSTVTTDLAGDHFARLLNNLSLSALAIPSKQALPTSVNGSFGASAAIASPMPVQGSVPPAASLSRSSSTVAAPSVRAGEGMSSPRPTPATPAPPDKKRHLALLDAIAVESERALSSPAPSLRNAIPLTNVAMRPPSAALGGQPVPRIPVQAPSRQEFRPAYPLNHGFVPTSHPPIARPVPISMQGVFGTSRGGPTPEALLGPVHGMAPLSNVYNVPPNPPVNGIYQPQLMSGRAGQGQPPQLAGPRPTPLTSFPSHLPKSPLSLPNGAVPSTVPMPYWDNQPRDGASPFNRIIPNNAGHGSQLLSILNSPPSSASRTHYPKQPGITPR